MRLTLALVSAAAAAPGAMVVEALRFLPEHARGGAAAANNPHLVPPDAASFPASSEAFTLSVPLDHFSTTDHRRFDDHFFVDASCWDKENGGPIFVEMGGEGPTSGAHCSTTHQRYGAMAVSVEHRFYGASIPYDDRNVSMLQFLSVEQNLADTAAIIEFIRSNHSLGAGESPVVTFGGSYSGGTAAWFRMAYPNVTHASVSSSGVVNAIVNFTEFDDQVAKAIDLPRPGCAARLGEHVEVLQAYFTRGEGAKVKARFGASNLIGTAHGDADFWYMAADAAAMADQYGNKEPLCEAMRNTTLPPAHEDPWAWVENYADFVSGFWGPSFASQCFYDSECLKTPDNGSMARSWRWQKCSELFYLQPSYHGDPVRSAQLRLADEMAQCNYVFGPGTAQEGLRRNAAFQRRFGGAAPGSGELPASKIYFEDFSDDPWSRASVERQLADDLPFCYLECNGCGHCGAGVPHNLTKCSDMQMAVLDKWLN